MKRALVYLRVSTKDQVEEEVSLPAQAEAAARVAEKLGATVERTFEDEGRSAFKQANRPGFEAAIDYATTRGLDYFITWSSSRFARNLFEATVYKHELDRAGVELVYVSAPVDRTTNEGWLYDSIMQVFDELRSRDTSKDTKRSLIHNAEQGYFVGGIAPYGFASIPAPDNPKRRKLVPLPEEAIRVQEVFQMRSCGMGGAAIAAKFNAQGIRYRSGTWKKAAVLALLRNPAMIGQTIFNRHDSRAKRPRPKEDWIVLQTHDPIVDMGTWELVQAAMDAAADSKESRGYASSSHAFTGLLRCEHCGGTLIVETARGRGGRYSYYICRRARDNGECQLKRYPAPALDEFLNGIIFDRLLDQATLAEMAAHLVEAAGAWSTERRARRQTLASAISAIRARNSRLYDVLEMQGRDAPNLGDMAARLRANNDEMKRLEQELTELEEETPPTLLTEGVDLSDLSAEIRSLFTESASVDRLRTFYQSFIRGITLRAGQAEIEYEPAQLVAVTAPVHRIENWGRWAASLRTRTLRVPLVPLRGRGLKVVAATRDPGQGPGSLRTTN